MGCGGSKEEVATGNTVTRRMLRRASSVVKRKTAAGADASKQQAADEANPSAAEKAADAGGGCKLESKDSSEEYFSSRREMEGLEVASMVTGSEGAEYFSPNEDGDARAVAGDREEKPLKEVCGDVDISEEDRNNAKKVDTDEEKGKEDLSGKEASTVFAEESIGKLSVDFEEAIAMDGAELDAAKSEKNNAEENKTELASADPSIIIGIQNLLTSQHHQGISHPNIIRGCA